MKRHSFDPISFVFGLVVAAIGFVFLFGKADVTDFHGAWIWPFPVIALGLLMLLTARRRGEEAVHRGPASDRDRPEGPAPEATEAVGEPLTFDELDESGAGIEDRSDPASDPLWPRPTPGSALGGEKE